MKIKEFEFDLELQANGVLFITTDIVRFELKMFDAINKENPTTTKDFQDMEKLFSEDPERGRILSYLIMKGWSNLQENSPMFNMPGVAEAIRNELKNEDL